MKKILSLIMALVLCLGLCACETTNSTKTQSTKTESNNSHTQEKPVLLSSRAETLASGYVSSYTSKIQTAAKPICTKSQ